MISLKAWAKVNIGLKIGKKREDGYHNIETTLSTINLSDLIDVESTNHGIELISEGIKIPEKDNLCYKAARLFIDKFGIKQGVRIKLIKNIPIGGGLGGGSSDAAVILKGLDKLFNIKCPEQELFALAKHLGADVPFFIRGGAAYVRGIGDQLKYFSLPRMNFIIYYPGYPISTKWAYEEYDRLLLTPTPDMNMIIEKPKKKKRISFALENDFEKVVFKKHPDLLDIKANLLGAGAFFVFLSGSGSCLITLVDESIREKVLNYLDNIGAQYYEVYTI